jgi:hypothetical protein
MSAFERAMAAFAALDEPELGCPWTFGGVKMDARYALYRLLEDAQGALVDAARASHPESRRILALAQAAFGDLRGLLVGLPAEWLDQAPRAGEWPLRDTLRHVLLVERRYLHGTLWALERSDADPVRTPDDRLPKPADIDASGDTATILDRLAVARTESNRRLGDVGPSGMTRPTVWVSYDVDVRFRLHRFAAHLHEHTIQCEKTLAGLGWPETEGRRIVRRLWRLCGELEGLGATGAVSSLEAAATERLASVRAALAGGPPATS